MHNSEKLDKIKEILQFLKNIGFTHFLLEGYMQEGDMVSYTPGDSSEYYSSIIAIAKEIGLQFYGIETMTNQEVSKLPAPTSLSRIMPWIDRGHKILSTDPKNRIIYFIVVILIL